MREEKGRTNVGHPPPSYLTKKINTYKRKKAKDRIC